MKLEIDYGFSAIWIAICLALKFGLGLHIWWVVVLLPILIAPMMFIGTIVGVFLMAAFAVAISLVVYLIDVIDNKFK